MKLDTKPPPSEATVPERLATGGIRKAMDDAFASLPEDDRKTIIAELNAHEKYLYDLHAASAARISAVIKRTASVPYGPGSYLARWQHLLDTTLITPSSLHGPVRSGGSRSVKEESRTDFVNGAERGFISEEQAEKAFHTTPAVPSADRTLDLLGPRFREILAGE